MKHIRVVALANRQDIVADFSEYESENGREGALFVGDNIWLPSVFYPGKPRVLVMHQTGKGIEVGMAAVNIDDPDDAIKIPFLSTHIVHSYRLPQSSKLLAAYLKTTSPIDLSATLQQPIPVKPSMYRAG